MRLGNELAARSPERVPCEQTLCGDGPPRTSRQRQLGWEWAMGPPAKDVTCRQQGWSPLTKKGGDSQGLLAPAPALARISPEMKEDTIKVLCSHFKQTMYKTAEDQDLQRYATKSCAQSNLSCLDPLSQ